MGRGSLSFLKVLPSIPTRIQTPSAGCQDMSVPDYGICPDTVSLVRTNVSQRSLQERRGSTREKLKLTTILPRLLLTKQLLLTKLKPPLQLQNLKWDRGSKAGSLRTNPRRKEEKINFKPIIWLLNWLSVIFKFCI